MFKISVFFVGLVLVGGQLKCQERTNNIILLAEGRYFESLILDPTECLISTAIYKIRENGQGIKGVYIPANLAFHQSLLRLEKEDGTGYEFGLEAAAFTQFEIKYIGDNKYLGGMMNVDYRATGFINYLNQRFSLRARLFHISSHLADDYIIRNEITTPTPNTLNYEQIDLTASYNYGPIRYYGGLGHVITPNSTRKRFSTQVGVFYRGKSKAYSFVTFVAGLDVKVFEENKYRPNYRAAVGIEIGRAKKRHLLFLLDYYNGHLPYSTHEFRQISWLGISSIVLPAAIK